ncbi:protein DMP7-like [Olea europaea var. sylvestris]|uniref:protein DMP7-like n=1 Tax=Olea europaea var. sylvestris TaxID=158386 RepID=UPI000C1D6AD1|nr:protein DMP7-like [Olea europaea var. sylvestris]
MDVHVEDGKRNGDASIEEQLESPLLEAAPTPPKPPKTRAQTGIRKAFKGTAHLSNLLPTGSVLTFQFLSPVVTHEGKCKSFVSQSVTSCVLALCAVSCFLFSFTDSFRDERGKVRYGLATFRGLWVIDGSKTFPPQDADKYRITFIDFVHAFMSILVFGAVAMFDKNVINCFYPSPSEEGLEILTALPITIGVICSILFIVFPSKRHGVGFPLSRN